MKLANVNPDDVNIELINKKVIIGHKVVTEMNYTAGAGVAPTFYFKGHMILGKSNKIILWGV
ncbi:hypothetical protein [Desulfoscipio geothermicus]|uniref:hypothetical protein n=1 Tax=Desulfoscipio geothermicus TaxID=39060 RepID=UPI000B8273AD|nr:hypothetical protein [Desulfoscipio geothermicus]